MAMAIRSSGRIEVPNAGTLDLEFSNNQSEIYGFQIHTTEAMEITGEGFSSEQGQNSECIIMRRATAGVAQQEYTEVDGVLEINTAPIPFYPKKGTHKMHIANNSGNAGYITVFAISAGRYH